jgi:hypothetical protein
LRLIADYCNAVHQTGLALKPLFPFNEDFLPAGWLQTVSGAGDDAGPTTWLGFLAE